jgi:hypothetical protein
MALDFNGIPACITEKSRPHRITDVHNEEKNVLSILDGLPLCIPIIISRFT